MANPEHVAVVRAGTEAVDAWRRAHPRARLDLREANLRGADLSDADLTRANLGEANLEGAYLRRGNLFEANLSEANLGRANLGRANLGRANLRWANLTGANLFDADLTGADLTGANLIETDLVVANLIEADLRRADLTGANLSSAILPWARLDGTKLGQARFAQTVFGFTVIADCDLSGALGLDTVRHLGPSTIGVDTIVRSGGNIPEAFLRGAGVPEVFITYMRSLVGAPIQFYTCFISYASPDQLFADRLYADLQARGVRCWYYRETAAWGRRIEEDIDRAIHVFDKTIVICSEESLGSPAVLREIEKAIAKEDTIARENAHRQQEARQNGEQPVLKDKDVLFPIRLDDHVLHGWQHPRRTDVTNRTIGDFVGWDKDAQRYERSLNRLLNALDPKSWPAVD